MDIQRHRAPSAGPGPGGSLRCLVLAPSGDDARLIGEVLAEAGISTAACADLDQLCAEVPLGAAAVVIAEEAVTTEAASALGGLITGDPVWSVLPFVLLSSADAARTIDVHSLFGVRGLVTVLQRPCATVTLITAVRSALYTRERQYEVRSLVDRLEGQAAELARSNDDLHRFAHAAAHDLQEPLRMIASYITLIQKRQGATFDERSREYMGFVVGGALRMSGLIKSLLQYAQVGQAKLDVTGFAADLAVGEALTNLKLAVEEADAVVTVDELPTVVADRTLVVELLQNLLTNAIKYRRGRPEIRISCQRDGDGHWIFAVADNGLGIPAEQRQRIFEAFHRAHSSHEPGFGIGLATCKRIAELHGGKIWVESTPDVGSTFFVSLPVEAAAQD